MDRKAMIEAMCVAAYSDEQDGGWAKYANNPHRGLVLERLTRALDAIEPAIKAQALRDATQSPAMCQSCAQTLRVLAQRLSPVEPLPALPVSQSAPRLPDGSAFLSVMAEARSQLTAAGVVVDASLCGDCGLRESVCICDEELNGPGGSK